mgnify:CR=1 FL=1
MPGRIDFYGSTLVGIPVLRAGFNDRLGFVTTNNAPDLDDVFTLRIAQEGVANADQPEFVALKGYLRRKAGDLGLDVEHHQLGVQDAAEHGQAVG